MSARNFKLIGAAGAAALTVGVLAGPAAAAGEETADVSYTCVTAAGNATPSATYAVDAPPATMVAGQTVKLPTTSTITLDATTTALAVGAFGWAKFDGTIVTPTTGTTVGQNLTIARTAMGTSGNPTVATATGKTILRATKAGTYTLKLGNLGSADGKSGAVTLKGYDASDAFLNSVVFPDGGAFGQCTNDAGKTPLVNSAAAPATVKVTKDRTTTVVAATYNGKKDIATGKAKVKSHFGLAATGKVKFTLKKGTHVVKTLKTSLNKKGIAVAHFKHVSKKGKYSITGKYLGNAALKTSSGKDAFRVS